MDYRLYKNISPASSIWSRGGDDSAELKALENIRSGGSYWSGFSYTGNQPFVLPQSIPCAHSYSIMPYYGGWRGSNPQYGVFTCGGFRFTNRNTVSILSPLPQFGAQGIIGYGSFSQLTNCDYATEVGERYEGRHYNGVMSVYYDFHIFEPI